MPVGSPMPFPADCRPLVLLEMAADCADDVDDVEIEVEVESVTGRVDSVTAGVVCLVVLAFCVACVTCVELLTETEVVDEAFVEDDVVVALAAEALVVDVRDGHNALRISPLKMRPRRVVSSTSTPLQRRFRRSCICTKPVRQLLEHVDVVRKSSVVQPPIAELYIDWQALGSVTGAA